jgi:cobaltochelatase CobS
MQQREKHDFCIADTFNVKVPKEIKQTGYKDPGIRTPDVHPDYVINQSYLSDFLTWYNHGRPEGLHIFGPTGSGKSSFVLEVCARLNVNVERPPMHEEVTWADLIGFYTVIDGDFVFQEGPLTNAMKYGHLLLLDENDSVDPSINSGLHAILEGAPLILSQMGGIAIKAAEGFGIVTTGNTAGSGDQTGLYQNPKQQSIAYMDRFWVNEMDYNSPEIEVEILKKAAPSLDDKTNQRMVEYANVIRDIFNNKGSGDNLQRLPSVNVTFSTRSLVRWGRMIEMFAGVRNIGKSPVHFALDRALANRAHPEAKQGLHEIAQRIFGEPAKL